MPSREEGSEGSAGAFPAAAAAAGERQKETSQTAACVIASLFLYHRRPLLRPFFIILFLSDPKSDGPTTDHSTEIG